MNKHGENLMVKITREKKEVENTLKSVSEIYVKMCTGDPLYKVKMPVAIRSTRDLIEVCNEILAFNIIVIDFDEMKQHVEDMAMYVEDEEFMRKAYVTKRGVTHNFAFKEAARLAIPHVGRRGEHLSNLSEYFYLMHKYDVLKAVVGEISMLD